MKIKDKNFCSDFDFKIQNDCFQVASLIGEHEEIVARMRGEHETRVSSYESQLCDLRTQLNTANEQFEQAKASAEQSDAQLEIAKRNQQMMLV